MSTDGASGVPSAALLRTCPHGGHERDDLLGILHAWRRLDAGRDIDRERCDLSDRRRDVPRIEPASEHDLLLRELRAGLLRERPVEGLAGATAARRRRVE